MSLLFTSFLIGSAMIGLPLWLHFLRKRTTVRVPFPSLKFLSPKVLRESKRHRIRRWLVLVFRCLAILCVIIAFARPFFERKRIVSGRAVIVIVDDSFSMHAESRWESIRDWGLSELQQLGKVDEVGLMAVRNTPTWLLPLSENVSRIPATLSTWQPGYYAADYADALRLAAATLHASPHRDLHIILLADHQSRAWANTRFDQPLPPGVQLHTPAPPTELLDQAALHSLKLRSVGRLLHVEFMSCSYAPLDQERVLSIYVQGERIHQDTLLLQVGAEQTWSYELPLPETVDPAEPIAVELSLDADSLPVDDAVAGVIDPRAGIPVRLDAQAHRASDPPIAVDYVYHALAATQYQEQFRLSPQMMDATPWPDDALFVLRGAGLSDAAERMQIEARLKAGKAGLVFAEGGAALSQWLVSEGIQLKRLKPKLDQSYRLEDWDMAHSLVGALDTASLGSLMDVDFESGWALESASMLPLARWSNGSVAVGEVMVGGGRLIVFGFRMDRSRSELVISSAFVPLMHQSLVYLSDQVDRREVHEIGDWVSLAPGTQVDRLQGMVVEPLIQHLDGDGFRVEAPGLYHFQGEQLDSWIAVSLPVDESDLSTWPKPSNIDGLVSSEKRAQTVVQQATLDMREKVELEQQFWWWFIVAALIFLLFEMSLANRTAS
ncbi:BatA and WFA domain-containing protein [Coraliomargarita sp. SDUM461003]|uniref:BatA and WFA domain-containing protein n=1 Tax=Thalassobacterium maritimum TaxID=3041265 RepID=A0ABU1AT46_9BACT|nr:BatA and WFA domain-containing protein [Coraliomargarita sp. SDUM461003]MDQ8206792.1 BatA and WFA domain-containing protein [Coraliomargarita sp. SDUM461003]